MSVVDTESVPDITPEDLCRVDAAYWADYRKIRIQGGVFSFFEHEYQKEPMQSDARRIVWQKATQGGVSELEILKTLHGLIFKRFPKGVLYMFPTTDDVNEFSKSRFGPLIQANKYHIGRYVKSGGVGTDTASLKKVHDAFLYLRGARLSQSVGVGAREKESGKLRGIPVDRVVFDELDLMDESVILKALGRMGDSLTKEEVYISNPTLPDYGINKVFQKSDQRYFHNRCPHCGEWTCPTLDFPECVKLRENRTGYIACKKCGRELKNRTDGEWVAAAPQNSDYMHGYQWSQLNSARNDPAEILEQFNDPPQGNIGDIYRLKLGLPYVAAENRLTEGQVYACCNNEVMSTSSRGPCAMGVDVGKIKHVIVGVRTHKERWQILKVIKLSRWEDIHDLAKRFNVRSAVVDIRPYEDEARRFQAAEPYRVGLCEYSENVLQDGVWDKNNTVKVYRTGIFDRIHTMFAEQQVVLPRKSPEIDTFVAQVCAVAKVLETNQRTGTAVYRYHKVGSAGDHYRNAMNYFFLAARGGRLARVESSRTVRQKYAINNFHI